MRDDADLPASHRTQRLIPEGDGRAGRPLSTTQSIRARMCQTRVAGDQGRCNR